MYETDGIFPDTFRGWLIANHSEDIPKIADIGAFQCDGMRYYHQTTPAYERFHIEIWERLREDAEAYRYPSIPMFMATHAFRYADDIKSDLELKMYLVWYMAEQIAKEITSSPR